METKARSRGKFALPPAVSQNPGKYLCFLVTRTTEKQHVDSEDLVLSLARSRDFLVERGEVESMGTVRTDTVIFSDSNIELYLHKKYYLSIG